MAPSLRMLVRTVKQQKPRMQPGLLPQERCGTLSNLGRGEYQVQTQKLLHREVKARSWWWSGGCPPQPDMRASPRDAKHLRGLDTQFGLAQFGLGSRPYSCILR
jgi:hypothetical protein